MVFASLLVCCGAAWHERHDIPALRGGDDAVGTLFGRVQLHDHPLGRRPGRYRGTASGFAYMFVDLSSSRAVFLFPALLTAIGQANATLFVAIFPLIGLLAAIFILPEVYGYEQD